MDQVSAQFNLDDITKGWYVGCALAGSIAGVMVAGSLSDKFGRKIVLLLSAVLFSVSGIGCMIAANEVQLVIARILGGIGIGVASVISPLYIAEISVPSFPGTDWFQCTSWQLQLVSLEHILQIMALLQYSETLLNAGASQGLYGKIFATEVWRGMLGMEALPALLFFMALFFIPESPRWLIVKGEEKKALINPQQNIWRR